MGSAKNYRELNQLILLKEAELLSTNRIMKIRIEETKKSLTPINLIQTIISKLVSTPDLKTELIKTGIGLVTNYIQKKIGKKRKAQKEADRGDESTQKIIDIIIEKKSGEIKEALKHLLKTESKKQTG